MAYRLASLRELVLFRVRTFYREPGIMFWVFVFPVLALGALGLAFRPGEPGPASIGLVGDAVLRGGLDAEPALRVRAFATVEEGDRALGRGEVVLVLVAGSPPRFRLDPARPEALPARLLVERRLQELGGQRDVVHAAVERVATPGMRYVDFLVPGLIGMQIMNTTLLGVALSLVEMRARRMMRRFAVTPMPRSQLLLAQIAGRLVFTWIMTAFLLAVARVTFGVQVRGSTVDLALLVVLGGLSFSGISIAIAARVTSAEVAQGVVTLIAVPMVLLSGVFFSSSGAPFGSAGMPPWLRTSAGVLPLTIFNEALRAVMNEGEPMTARVAVALLLWGGVPFVAGLRLFRWT